MTKKLKSFIYEGKEIDFPFPIEVEIIEGRADNSQVLKTLVDAYNELKEKSEIKSPIFYSQRHKVVEEFEAWAKENNATTDNVNLMAFLQSKGYLNTNNIWKDFPLNIGKKGEDKNE